jgi:hypothetical protein
MKKTYINPTIEVVKIASQKQILAGSETIATQGNYGDGTGITTGARNFDFDDEEEY